MPSSLLLPTNRLAYQQALEHETRMFALREEDRVRNADRIKHNSQRSKCIVLRQKQAAWEKHTGEIFIDEVLKLPYKLQGGKQFFEPKKKALFQRGNGHVNGGISDPLIHNADFVIPKSMPRESTAECIAAKAAVRDIQTKSSALFHVTADDWVTKLNTVDPFPLRSRIARFVWWDYASRQPAKVDLLDLVEAEIDTQDLMEMEKEDLAIALWHVGYPAIFAQRRVVNVEKPSPNRVAELDDETPLALLLSGAFDLEGAPTS